MGPTARYQLHLESGLVLLRSGRHARAEQELFLATSLHPEPHGKSTSTLVHGARTISHILIYTLPYAICSRRRLLDFLYVFLCARAMLWVLNLACRISTLHVQLRTEL